MRTKPVVIAGKEYNGPKLAAKIGIAPWEVVRKRLARGWQAHDAFHDPVHVAGDPVPSDAGKAAWHEAERLRHEVAAERHRVRRDAALKRIDDAEAARIGRIERVVDTQQGTI